MRDKAIRPRCAVADCPQEAVARGLCMHHYHRLRTWGDPLGTRPARLPKAPVTEQACSRCGRVRPIAEFPARYRQCVDCQREARHAQYERRRADRLAKARTYAAAHRDSVLAYKRAYYAARRDELDAKSKRWAEANRERRRQIAREYNRRHPDKMADSRHQRRARMKGAFVEPVAIETLYARDGGVCQICRQPVARNEASIDHIIPIVDGGAHALWNVQLAHRTCNYRRNRGYIPAQTRLPM